MESILEGWCLVQGVCAEAGGLAAGNACLVCDPATAEDAWSDAALGSPCEDGNPCTENDTCDAGTCFAGSPPSCADGVLCTQDACDPETGCSHVPDHASCADENPCTDDLCAPEAGGCTNAPDDTLLCTDFDVCTPADRCEGGACVSDPPVACDDANPCTDESCHPVFGCLYTFNELPCDDAASCTEDDVCHWGICLGQELWTGACPACELTFSPDVQKIVKIVVGSGGWEGEALNVDGDLKTCAPSGSCENGLDNALSFAGELLNDVIAQNIEAEDDNLTFTVELVDPSWAGNPFLMNLYYAELSDQNPLCDFQEEVCIYRVWALNFDPLCNVQVSFDNTTVEGGVLTAGGSGYIFPFQLSFAGGTSAELVLFNARVQATLSFDGDGSVASMDGIFGGAVTPQHILEMLEAIDAQYFPGGQETKEMLLGLVPLMNPDIDLDGDGTGDAISIGLVFSSIPGILEDYTG